MPRMIAGLCLEAFAIGSSMTMIYLTATSALPYLSSTLAVLR